MDLPPTTDVIRLEIDGPVVTVTLDRASKYNAMNVEMIEGLISVLSWVKEHAAATVGNLVGEEGRPRPRILHLQAEGRHFCAGADIHMMREAGASTPEANRANAARLDALFNGLWSSPCFTIASIRGVALGGGAGLVACADYVIAEQGARIALSEAKLGILPAVIGPYVHRRVGSAAFRRLAMQASRVNAEEALRLGLIDEVVELPEARAHAVIQEVLTTGPVAIAEAKALTLTLDRWNSSDPELRGAMMELTSRMRESQEGQEGLSAFLEGRPPNWHMDEA